MFTFRANAGHNPLELVPGSSISWIEKVVSSLFPVKHADPENCFIFIRASQPFVFLPGSILLMFVSGGMGIGGLVAGILVR